MATIYQFNVEIVSDFCAYPKEEIKKKLEEAIKSFEYDQKNGLLVRSRVTETKLKEK